MHVLLVKVPHQPVIVCIRGFVAVGFLRRLCKVVEGRQRLAHLREAYVPVLYGRDGCAVSASPLLLLKHLGHALADGCLHVGG